MSIKHPPEPPTLRQPPFTDRLPAPVFFRTERVTRQTTFPPLRHAWGEFIYSFSGVTEIKTAAHHFLAPPHMGLWVAPETEHVCFNNAAAVYCSVYVARELCSALPDHACAVLVSPLLRALLEHLRTQEGKPETPTERSRLLRVLVDQLSACPTTGSFVPYTDAPELAAILQSLRDCPSDDRTLAELAADFHTTERSLMRHSRKLLGMSLTEWRQRLRLVSALPLLNGGHSVESVALDTGYATSSAFIAMFRRYTGTSPGKFIAEKK